MNPVLKIILQGVYDEESILNYLRGTPHIVKKIWLFLKSLYISYIKLPDERDGYGDEPKGVTLENEVVLPDCSFLKKFKAYEYHSSCILQENDLLLPSPTDININMMPYIYGGQEFRDYKLPGYLIPYFPLIKFCKSKGGYYDSEQDKGSIYYLTIQEGWVEPHETQRRPGIHTDNPGPVRLKDIDKLAPQNRGSGISTLRWYEHHWGNGVILSSQKYVGGIFMTSSVPNSCCAWNCKIERDSESGTEIIGQHGSCEHLREFLPEECKIMMEPNVLYWITDRTPHESLPMKERTYRQFFRVVTENVSLWFADHSTPNPCGVLPDPSITKIVRGNKFDPESLEIIEHEAYSC